MYGIHKKIFVLLVALLLRGSHLRAMGTRRLRIRARSIHTAMRITIARCSNTDDFVGAGHTDPLTVPWTLCAVSIDICGFPILVLTEL